MDNITNIYIHMSINMLYTYSVGTRIFYTLWFILFISTVSHNLMTWQVSLLSLPKHTNVAKSVYIIMSGFSKK